MYISRSATGMSKVKTNLYLYNAMETRIVEINWNKRMISTLDYSGDKLESDSGKQCMEHKYNGQKSKLENRFPRFYSFLGPLLISEIRVISCLSAVYVRMVTISLGRSSVADVDNWTESQKVKNVTQ